MAGGIMLAVEVNPWAIDRRIKHGYLDKKAESLDEALRMVEEAKEKEKQCPLDCWQRC